MKHQTLIKQIARQSMRPCPEISPAKIAIRLADGFRFSPYGSIPWPARIVDDGFCYLMPDNTRHGRFASRHAAARRWNYIQLRNAVRYLRELRVMQPDEIREHAAVWSN